MGGCIQMRVSKKVMKTQHPQLERILTIVEVLILELVGKN